MDIRNDKTWFGQMILSGISKPFNAEGTIAGITAQFHLRLIEQSARKLTEGKEILITFRDRPFTDSKESSILKKAQEVISGLDEIDCSENSPFPNESYEDYYDRLISQGFNHFSAAFFANDWFKREQNPRLNEWLTNPRARKFREINSSPKAFESCAPGEYEILKQFVLKEFPEFTDSITFRTA